MCASVAAVIQLLLAVPYSKYTRRPSARALRPFGTRTKRSEYLRSGSRGDDDDQRLRQRRRCVRSCVCLETVRTQLQGIQGACTCIPLPYYSRSASSCVPFSVFRLCVPAVCVCVRVLFMLVSAGMFLRLGSHYIVSFVSGCGARIGGISRSCACIFEPVWINVDFGGTVLEQFVVAAIRITTHSANRSNPMLCWCCWCWITVRARHTHARTRARGRNVICTLGRRASKN